MTSSATESESTDLRFAILDLIPEPQLYCATAGRSVVEVLDEFNRRRRMAELVLNEWRNDRRGVVHNRTRPSLLRDVFSHVASQDFVHEALVPDAAAACLLAELIEHPGIDANGDQLARFIAKGRATDAPHRLELLRR